MSIYILCLKFIAFIVLYLHFQHARKKITTVMLIYNGPAAIRFGSIFALLAMLLFHFEVLPGFDRGWPLKTILFSRWTLWAGVLVTTFVMIFWRPQTRVFLDRICIHQDDKILKAQAILSLGGILKKSDSMLILWDSMLRWMGPWQRFPLKDLQTWASAVETSIWGSRIPSGRSRFLFWSCVAGMECHPKCAIDVETIKMEWRRQVCVKFNLPAPTSPTKQASKVLAEIKWTVLPNGVWSTPFGHLRLGWVADKTVVRLARRSWSRLLYDNDTKVNHPLPAHLEPHLEFSKNVIKEGGERYKQTVAVAAATDGRLLLRKEHPVHCECGDQCPTRHHLTFECQSHPGEKI